MTEGFCAYEMPEAPLLEAFKLKLREGRKVDELIGTAYHDR